MTAFSCNMVVKVWCCCCLVCLLVMGSIWLAVKITMRTRFLENLYYLSLRKTISGTLSSAAECLMTCHLEVCILFRPNCCAECRVPTLLAQFLSIRIISTMKRLLIA